MTYRVCFQYFYDLLYKLLIPIEWCTVLFLFSCSKFGCFGQVNCLSGREFVIRIGFDRFDLSAFREFDKYVGKKK